MNSVLDLQRRLSENGLDCGPLDGIWGARTLNATCEGIKAGVINADADLAFLKLILIRKRPTLLTMDRYAGALMLVTGTGGVKASNKADFEKNHLVTVSVLQADGKRHSLRINKCMEAPFRLAFAEIEYWNAKEPHKAWMPKVIGSWCIRLMSSNKKKPSTHSWACAFDVDPTENAAYTKGVIPSWVVETLEGWGFCWGGRWKTYLDPMHFQYVGLK